MSTTPDDSAMTGAEHYRAAEELLSCALDPDTGRLVVTGDGIRELFAAAQVHATLAMAASYLNTMHLNTGRTTP